MSSISDDFCGTGECSTPWMIKRSSHLPVQFCLQTNLDKQSWGRCSYLLCFYGCTNVSWALRLGLEVDGSCNRCKCKTTKREKNTIRSKSLAAGCVHCALMYSASLQKHFQYQQALPKELLPDVRKPHIHRPNKAGLPSVEDISRTQNMLVSWSPLIHIPYTYENYCHFTVDVSQHSQDRQYGSNFIRTFTDGESPLGCQPWMLGISFYGWVCLWLRQLYRELSES